MDLIKTGDFIGALKHLTIALEKDKDDIQIMNTQVTILNRAFRDFLFPQTTHMSDFVNWITKEAESGNSMAQNNLGYMFLTSRGVNVNFKEARRLFTLSANQGNVFAVHNLGYMSTFPTDSPKNNDTAIKWYISGAEKGFFLSHEQLCIIRNKSHEDTWADYLLMKKENENLKKQLDTLTLENETLKIELDYRPGGDGYQKAKIEAESLFARISKQTEICCDGLDSVSDIN